ncbi:unnamed protein product, partial [Citrullus colocynthis]
NLGILMVNLMRRPSSRSCHGGSSTGNDRASTHGGGGQAATMAIGSPNVGR